MIRHIPIFIPHLGCPHQCVFCDQRAISGTHAFRMESVRPQIERALSTIRKDENTVVEIAYFGGSFTAIPYQSMHELLAIAQSYVDRGLVNGIRFSTRPDALPESLLDSLQPYRVSAIELGLQSFDDDVLGAACRGHSASDAMDACRRVVQRGYTLTGQMMLGLPGSTPKKEIDTAVHICALGAKEARIYPTVVLRDTALAVAMRKGEYTPLSVEEAVQRAAAVKDVFDQSGVRCLRIGLCENEELRSDRVLAGAHHPAMGELVYAAQFRHRMEAQLDQLVGSLNGACAVFSVAVGHASQAIGQKKENIRRLCQRYGLRGIQIREDASLGERDVRFDQMIR